MVIKIESYHIWDNTISSSQMYFMASNNSLGFKSQSQISSSIWFNTYTDGIL